MAVLAETKQLEHIACHISGHGHRRFRLISVIKEHRTLQFSEIHLSAGCSLLIPTVSHRITACNPTSPRQHLHNGEGFTALRSWKLELQARSHQSKAAHPIKGALQLLRQRASQNNCQSGSCEPPRANGHSKAADSRPLRRRQGLLENRREGIRQCTPQGAAENPCRTQGLLR